MTHQGSCHCQAVTFSVDLPELTQAMTCNCSMCKRAGTALAFVSADQFTLQTGEDKLSHYQFNKRVIDHVFCSICGIKPFAFGKDEQGKEVVAVNLRCIDGLDLSQLETMEYNGAAL